MKVDISDVIWEKNKIWFCSRNFNGLFCMDSQTGKVREVGAFPHEMYSKRGVCGTLHLIDDKIFCTPLTAKAIYVYDIKKEHFFTIEIDEKVKTTMPGAPYFFGTIVYKNYLFMLPEYSKYIVRINLDNYEMEYISDWNRLIEETLFDKMDLFFGKHSVLVKNKLYIPFLRMNAVLELDCDTLNCVLHKLDVSVIGFENICYSDGCLFLTSVTTGEIIKWNLETEEIDEIKVYDEQLENEFWGYAGMAKYEGNIILFPQRRELRKQNDMLQKVFVMEGQYAVAKTDDETLLYYEKDTAVLTKVHMKSGEKEEMELIISDLLLDMERICDEQQSIEECSDINLKQFLRKLQKVERTINYRIN